ncbi:MAG: hypothetical protein QW041_01800 [Candidatus Pacearchaeota archaeon]
MVDSMFEKKIKEKEDFVRREKINEKIKVITEVLGEPFSLMEYEGDGFSVLNTGRQYNDGNFKFIAYKRNIIEHINPFEIKKTEESCFKIQAKKEKTFFIKSIFNFIDYEEVYLFEGNDRLKICKDEKKWFSILNENYNIADGKQRYEKRNIIQTKREI